nr:hypothetical protein [uncultured bacterium]
MPELLRSPINTAPLAALSMSETRRRRGLLVFSAISDGTQS